MGESKNIIIYGDSLSAGYGMDMDKSWPTLLQNNSSVVLLGIKIPLNYGPRYTQDFENIFYDVAIDNDVDLVDFFMKNVALDENLMQDDGIHPNESAQPILLENVWETIKKNI